MIANMCITINTCIYMLKKILTGTTRYFNLHFCAFRLPRTKSDFFASKVRYKFTFKYKYIRVVY